MHAPQTVPHQVPVPDSSTNATSSSTSNKGKGKATSPPAKKIVLEHVARTKVFATTSAFTDMNKTEIRTCIQNALAKIQSLDSISFKLTRDELDAEIELVIVAFYDPKGATEAIDTIVHDVFKIKLHPYNPKDPLGIRQNNMDDSRAPENSNERTVRVTEIPLSFDMDTIYAAFGTYGKVKDVRLHTKGIWQFAYVEFYCAEAITIFYDVWAIMFMKHQMRVYPLGLSDEDYKFRSKYTAKLANLPKNTTTTDLLDIIDATKAKSCIIPKGAWTYLNRPFAFFHFESETDLNDAFKTNYSLANADLTWCALNTKLCNICGSTDHLVKNCRGNKAKVNKKFQNIYQRYKPANYEKLILKSRPQYGPRNPRSPDEAKVQHGKSFAQALSGNNNNNNVLLDDWFDDRTANKSTRPNSYTPNSAFEKAMMERFDQLDEKFEKFAMRLDDLEYRIGHFELEAYESAMGNKLGWYDSPINNLVQ